jgi:cytochrome P450
VLHEGSIALVAGEPTMLDDEQVAARAGKISAFQEAIAQLVQEKRCHPQDDLISQLLQAEEAGDRLSEPELLATIGLLIVAGHETTSNLIGNGMLALFDHPDQLARLKEDLTLVPMAVEELLRSTGPNLFTPLPRLVTEDIELGGQHLSQGDMVIPLLASANHDESWIWCAT